MPLLYYQFTSSNQPALTALQKSNPYFQKISDCLQAWQKGEQHFTLPSSGSTGTPKLISLTRTQMIASARATARALALPAHSKVLITLNVEMIAGFMMLVRTLENDWHATAIIPTSDPLAALPEDLSFDFVALTPMQLQTLLQLYTKEVIEHRFKKILLGGAAIDSSLQAQINTLSTEVYHSYGMTETVSHVALRRVNGSNSTDSFQLLEGIEAGIDERGCLHLKGAVTNDHLVQTNDLIEFTGPRQFTWIGRADNIINSGGIKIQLEKIDRVIGITFEELAIKNSFFSWYIPDDRLGQKLILIVHKTIDRLSTSHLKKALLQYLNKYELPKTIVYVEEFERTLSGKIDKRATANSFDKLGATLINLS